MLQPIRHGSAVLVDHNTFQRKLLRTVLRSSGFIRVSEFEDVEIGLDESSRIFPDFVFIDYETAQESELFRSRENMRTKMLGANTHMFILMQEPTRQRVTKAVGFGAHWVISRPFSPKSLNERLRAILNPGYATPVQPEPPSKRRAESLISRPIRDDDTMDDLSEHMHDLLNYSQDYKNQLSSTRAATRQNILNRIHELEKSLQSRHNAADARNEDNSVMLI
ncbi:response regulator [Cohaesibacter intestini]|uniref:response regulator n=1 Tax=Cohaesibacter intestini TaxID=2211145 RepID=UPI000DEABAAC|nr:response regulator [Cohaesibacter intestini]